MSDQPQTISVGRVTVGDLASDAIIVRRLDRSVPEGYRWPGMDTGNATVYYLDEQANYHGATPQFMVMRQEPGAQTIMAERCYRTHAVAIVDALRYVTSTILPERGPDGGPRPCDHPRLVPRDPCAACAAERGLDKRGPA